ncbi:hypothetical protein [Kineococcus aurantiacus]|uniref:Uncharacterized protein n=1 Tax=Kineococcus aurantiacus TaxID=37633 RepID=A0A7Y9AT27_9ACTN|nr:hypothetical protein [Kineococcus aurantiacus]NYD20949.1 hypothetical protein [Kineococcus aurantiacus]
MSLTTTTTTPSTSTTGPATMSLRELLSAARVPHTHQPRREVREIVTAIEAGMLEAPVEVAVVLAAYRAAVQSLGTAKAAQIEERLPDLTAQAAQAHAGGQALTAAQIQAMRQAANDDAAQARVLQVLSEQVLSTAGQLGMAVGYADEELVEQLRAGAWEPLRVRWQRIVEQLEDADPRDPAEFVGIGPAADRARAAREEAVQLAREVAAVRRLHRTLLQLNADAGSLGDLDERGLVHRRDGRGRVGGDALNQLVEAGVGWLPTWAELHEQARAPRVVANPSAQERAREAIAAAGRPAMAAW